MKKLLYIILLIFYLLPYVGVAQQYIYTIAPNPYFTSVALGEIEGKSALFKFGANQDIDSGNEDIISYGGLYEWATSAETVNVASTEADDDEGSTGMEVVVLVGLNASYIEIYDTVTLNGTSDVLSDSAFIRLYRMFGISSGSNGSNVGVISATQSTSGIKMAEIPIYATAGAGQSQLGIYTVPANKKLVIHLVNAYVADNNASVIELDFFVRNFGTNTWRSLLPIEIKESAGYTFSETNCYIVLSEKTDFRLFCRSVTSSNTKVSGYIIGTLVDN